MLSHTGYTLPLSGGEKRKQQQINKKQSRAKQGVTTGEHSCKNGFKNEQSECVKQKKKKESVSLLFILLVSFLFLPLNWTAHLNRAVHCYVEL